MTGRDQTEERKPGRLARSLTFFAGLGLVAAGLLVAVWFVKTKPTAAPRERPKTVPLVEVMELAPVRSEVRVEAMGTVTWSEEAVLQAEVSGLVVRVHPDLVPGGLVKKDAVLVWLDDRDYQLWLTRARAALSRAQAELRIEEGRQRVAAYEWEFMRESGQAGAGEESGLALREPQLESARAAVNSAAAEVERARLDLSRTRIKAPFDAVVLEAPADPGDRAAPGTMLARLVATESFWVKAAVRLDQVKWIELPDEAGGSGSKAIVFSPLGGEREGRVFKLLPGLTPGGRMAQVLITVPDPLGLKDAAGPGGRLLLDDLVRVTILGPAVDNVVRIPRTVWREGSSLWLVDDEDRLRIARPAVLWSTAEEVFVDADSVPFRRLISSHLGAPVEGMSLAVEGGAEVVRPRGSRRADAPPPSSVESFP